MRVDTGVTGRTSQVLVLSVRDVEVRLRVTVLLGKTEIDDINLVATLANSHEEVVRLNITVNKGLGVDVFNAGDKLIGQQQDSLQRELSVAEVEQILQAGSEKVKNHGIVVTLGSKPSYERDAYTTSKGLVDASLVFELWVLGFDTLKFDSNLFSRDDVRACGKDAQLEM